MKILVLFPHFLTPGGAAKTLLKYSKELNNRGHDIEILCAKISPEIQKENHELKFRELKIPISSSIKYWLFFPFWQYRINKAIKKYPDYILYPHVLPSNWWAWIFKKFHKEFKVIWHCHEPSAFIHSRTWINAINNPIMKIGAKIANPILKIIDIYLEKSNDIVYCNSKFIINEYESVYKKKVNVLIYPPIVIKKIDTVFKKEKQLLSVSHLSKFKNIDVLIEVFTNISNKHPDCKLIIIGEGEETENLKKLVTQNVIQNRIEFAGKVSDERLEKYFLTSWACVSCSENEPFGLVPVESMMHGTPVIAHNSGGPKETIIHNSTGYLYNSKNELAEYLNKILLLKKNEYEEMQKKCFELVKKYSLNETISKLESIFTQKEK